MALGNFKGRIIFILLLSLLNVAIFWGHYFNNVGFPYNFVEDYYAVPAFWTTAISKGVFPEWMPNENIGYPFALNTQSGFYYPVFWIFAILHIPYTLHSAVIVQALHVLFGSIGMFLLLNSIFKSSRYAFIGAVAFQFFGGFYAQSEEQDVIRAFALAPWVFYVFKLNTEDPKVTRPLLFIPIVIYLIATGGYPGNFISTLFIMPVFLSLQIIDSYLKHIPRMRLFKIGGAMLGFVILGILISAIQLGPIWHDRDELTRFHEPSSQITHASQNILDFPGLAIPNPLGSVVSLPGGTHFYDQSQLEMFTSLPMLIFASFISLSQIRKYWVFYSALLFSTNGG